jgi:addiction module RelB/DinJ family antitoxin
MAKTNNLHIRIDPVIQKKAEKVLRKLGLSIPDAITVFLNQVSLRGGLPFEVKLPEQTGKPRYFYGFELPEMSYDAQGSFEYFRNSVITPSFKQKYDAWLNQAIASSKKKIGEEWNEDMFWARVFKDNKSYGAFDSFADLFKGYGLTLEYCYSNEEVHGIVPPCVAGVYITGSEEKRLIKGEKSREIISLCRKFRRIIANFKEDDLQVFEVYDEETEELMASIYNPNDPNFMTSDDY